MCELWQAHNAWIAGIQWGELKLKVHYELNTECYLFQIHVSEHRIAESPSRVAHSTSTTPTQHPATNESFSIYGNYSW